MAAASYYALLMMQSRRNEQADLRKNEQQEEQIDLSGKSDEAGDASVKERKKICRACTKKGKISIIGNKVDLIAALRKLGNIDIDADDKLPKYLCKTCFDALQSSMKFRSTVRRSDKLLRKQLKEQTKKRVKKETYNFINYDNDDFNYDDYDEYTQIHTTVAKSEFPGSSQCKKVSVEIKIEREEGESSGKTRKSSGTRRIRQPDRIECEVCKKLLHKYYYKTHMSVMHGNGPRPQKPPAKKLDPDDTEPKFVCYVCGKSFRYQSGYSTHMLTHENNFPFKCQHCPYKGRYKGLLKIHLRTHTRDYKYQCTECVARFLTSSNLNKHMLIHKEKQFKCDTCNRAFHLKRQLEEHVQVNHLGVKNHICNICHKAFGYRRQMNKHQLYSHKREKMRSGIVPSYLRVEKEDQQHHEHQQYQ